MSAPDRGVRDDGFTGWPATVGGHFALGGHLAAAALCLESAAALCDEKGDWLCGALAEVLPADDEEPPAPVQSDREFLLDRAETHREKARIYAENGSALADAVASGLREDPGRPDSWDRRDDLVRALRPYAEAITGAALEAERILVSLDAALPCGNDPSPADVMPGVVRFLNQEAALFTQLAD